MKHRGRIQAQGENLEASEAWSQNKPPTKNDGFSAWTDTFQLTDNSTVDELVISLELSNESVLLSIELINAWIINNFSKQKMEKFIDKLFVLKETIFQADTTENEVYV